MNKVKKIPVISGNGTMTIEDAVCLVYNVTLNQIKSRSRSKELVDARRILVWYYVEVMNYTQQKSGPLIGRDHATARHLLITFFNFYATDKDYQKIVDNVLEKVNPDIINDIEPRYSRNDMIRFCSNISELPENLVSARLNEFFENRSLAM